MPILKKSNTKVELDKLDVYVEDRDPNSLFFQIFDVPETFPGGKTAFRINGSPYLRLNSEIKVEILNAEREVIYSEYPQYLEGSSRLVSIYVYPDELYGAATITIVGEASYIPGTAFTPRQNATTIPSDWQDVFNIRWQKQILVDPALRNDSKIRFYKGPVIDAQELYTPYLLRTYTTSSNPEFVNYNTGKISGRLVGSEYTLVSSQNGVFRREMVGGQLSVSTPSGYNQSYSTKIKEVINENIAIAKIPYQDTSSIPDSYLAIQGRYTDQQNALSVPSPTIYQNFEESDYVIRYETEATYSETEDYKSFAKVHINDMDTFSGDVYSVKLFMKFVGSDKGYDPIGDLVLESSELMVDSQSVNIDERYGYMYTQNTIDTYWTSSRLGTDDPAILMHTSDKILDAMYISGSVVARAKENYDVIFAGSQSIDFHNNTEYLFEATFHGKQTYKKILPDGQTKEAVLHIFASGSAFNDTPNLPRRFSKRGKLIDSLELKNLGSGITEKRFGEMDWGFYSDKTGNGQIHFVVDSGDWWVSGIGLSAAQETGFSPGSAVFVIPIGDWHRKQNVQFKAEFYNQKGDRADIFATSSEEYFHGSNTFIQGDDNVLSGSVFIGNAIGQGIEFSGVQSAFLRNVGYEGYYSASDGSAPGGFMIWSGSVLTKTNTLGGVPRYKGVGLELHGTEIPFDSDRRHALRFRTDTGRLEITGSIYATDGFFSGSVTANQILVPVGGISADPHAYYDSDSGKYYRAAITQIGYAHFMSGSIGGWQIQPNGTLMAPGNTFMLSGSGVISASDFYVSEAGALTASNALIEGTITATAGEIGGWQIGATFISGSNIIISSTGELQTSDYVSDLKGWRISSDFNGYAEFENCKIRGTLRTTVFEKETVNAVGGQLWVANSTVISASGVGVSETTMSVENASGWAVGEIAIIKKVNNTGFTTEYIKVDSSSLDTDSSTKYNGKLYVTRSFGGNLDWYFSQLKDPTVETLLGDSGSGVGIEYEPGQTIVSTGLSGSGYIRLNANPRDGYTPYIDIIERTGSGVYDLELRVRLGDLSGLSPALLFGDTSPGHGIYTENGYFSGKVIATSGSFTGRVHAGNMLLGTDVNDANDGMYINANNYWYDTGNFKVGDATNNMAWSGTTLNITGSVNALSGRFSGIVRAADMLLGENVNGANDGMYINANNYWYDTGVFKVGDAAENYIEFDGTDIILGEDVAITYNKKKSDVKIAVVETASYAGNSYYQNAIQISQSHGYTNWDLIPNTKYLGECTGSGYNVFIFDKVFASIQKGVLAKDLYDAGYAVLTFGDDTINSGSATGIYPITSTVSHTNYSWDGRKNTGSLVLNGMTKLLDENDPLGIGWDTHKGTINDTGANITGLVSESVVLARMTSGSNYPTIIYLENPQGGKWVHDQTGYIASSTIGTDAVLVQNIMNYLGQQTNEEIAYRARNSSNRLPYLNSTYIDSTTVQSPIIAGNDGYFSGQVGIGNTMKLGIDVNSTNDGMYINATNYWYTDGALKVGDATNNMVWTGTTLGITGSIATSAPGVSTQKIIISGVDNTIKFITGSTTVITIDDNIEAATDLAGIKLEKGVIISAWADDTYDIDENIKIGGKLGILQVDSIQNGSYTYGSFDPSGVSNAAAISAFNEDYGNTSDETIGVSAVARNAAGGKTGLCIGMYASATTVASNPIWAGYFDYGDVTIARGNLNIGHTRTPSADLDVNADAAISGTLAVLGDIELLTGQAIVGIGSSPTVRIGHNVGIATTPASNLHIYNAGDPTIQLDTGGTDWFFAIDDDQDDRLSIHDGTITSPAISCLTDQNVGIGTTAAVQRLSVNGNVGIKQNSDAYGGGLRLINAGGNFWSIWGAADNHLYLKYNGGANGGWISSAVDTGQITFTGVHVSITEKEYKEDDIGKVVVFTGKYKNLDGTEKPKISESLPIAKLANKPYDISVYGVISGIEDSLSDTREFHGGGSFVTTMEKTDNRCRINAVGEGAVWVTNYYEDRIGRKTKLNFIEKGCGLTTSPIEGLAMAQDDDLFHMYTLGKITQNCEFSLTASKYDCEEFEFSGSMYRKAFCGVFYYSG